MKQKKNIAILVGFAVLILVTGCSNNSAKSEITDYNWTLEMAHDLSGNVLAAVQDVNLKFEEDGTVWIEDEESHEVWSGTYVLEDVGDSAKLDLIFEKEDTVVTGVYGVTYYFDDTEEHTITLNTDEMILSFAGEAQTDK